MGDGHRVVVLEPASLPRLAQSMVGPTVQRSYRRYSSVSSKPTANASQDISARRETLPGMTSLTRLYAGST
jgi:hypothetical protein